MATTPQIHAAMAGITNYFGTTGVAMDGKNTHQKYRYQSITALKVGLNIALNKLGVYMTMSSSDSGFDFDFESGKGLLKTVFTFTFTSAVDGSSTSCSIPIMHSSKDLAKLSGQAASYALKAMAFTTFCVPTDAIEDIDSMDFTNDSTASSEVEEKGEVKPTAKTKRTRRTKAQIEADKAAAAKDGSEAPQVEKEPVLEPINLSADVFEAGLEDPNCDRQACIKQVLKGRGINAAEFAVWSKTYLKNGKVGDVKATGWLDYVSALDAQFPAVSEDDF